MVAQARAEAPIEACGILAGSNNRVEKLYKMTNAEKRSDHFMMEPAEQFKVVKDIRSSGLEMLAIFHSHPATPTRPSAEDIRLALTLDVTYVIVSLENRDHPAVKGFLLENGRVTEVPVRIVEQ
ncbi:MAG: M67 family metallopeptidase [Planctomycetes bacterium]|nr:M67 family metallopeptidase [Planctomycetota bacterium]